MAETTTMTMGRGLAAAAMAGVLAGCAATHVGEDWQCPLAQGAVCTSIAAADPAVATAPETEADIDAVPLYDGAAAKGEGTAGAGVAAVEPDAPASSAPNAGTATPGVAPAPAPEASPGCATTACRPLAWLARLFRPRRGDAADAPAADAASGAVDTAIEPRDEPGDAGVPAEAPSGADAESAEAITGAEGAGVVAPDADRAEPPEPPAAPTAAPAPLRTEEVVGRVWIAPFVDAHGLYHEAHWVRVVLAPPGWRRP